MFCNNYKTKKIVSCDIIRIFFVFIHENLISPLVTISKKKHIRLAKESNNIIINTKKQQKLAEIAVNRSQRDTNFIQNQAKLEHLATRNKKKTPVLRKQKSIKKNKT
jgi:hypothetical protein